MKLLMIVGHAKDVFIYNIAKHLKNCMDVNIDIIEYNDSSVDGQDYDFRYYDNVITMKRNFMLRRVKFFGNLIAPWAESRELKKILKGKQYDIIQVHYCLPLYVCSGFLKKQCQKLYLTFWGGERKKNTILRSNRLFNALINRFIRRCVTGIIATASIRSLQKKYGRFNIELHQAPLGSASCGLIADMLKNGKNQYKEYWGIPTDKITILIGYSGKRLHQHIPIIEELSKYPDLRNNVQIIAPMTRGATTQYACQVENSLRKSGFSYTIIKDRFLSDEEIAKLRVATDIVLQLSEFDGYSRSIVECLCAKALMIYGSWINYDGYLYEDDYYALKCDSIEDGISLLSQSIETLGSYEKELERNRMIGESKYTWEKCIIPWKNIYSNI